MAKAKRYALATALYFLSGAFIASDWGWLWHIGGPLRFGVVLAYAIFLLCANLSLMSWEDFE